MKEKTMLKLALIISVIGITMLYVLSDSIELDDSAINKITIENQDDIVKVKGTITNVIDTDSVTILTISQEHETKAVIFKQDSKEFELKEGNRVEILGKIDEYNGELEIIAQRARIIG